MNLGLPELHSSESLRLVDRVISDLISTRAFSYLTKQTTKRIIKVFYDVKYSKRDHKRGRTYKIYIGHLR